ncbi:MAG: HEAT repeat domain-containing protein [Planctomycetia bacterium]|nr:HEAT repeat domain-containing protein [Planctomycetia bacterium]
MKSNLLLLPVCVLCLGTIGLVDFAAAADDAGNDLIQTVITLVSDKDKDVRALGLDQVRTEAKGTAATKQFAALLPKLSPEAQAALLSALADRGDAAARPAVVAILSESHDDAVRPAAILALGALGDPSDAAQLARLAIAESKAEQKAARKSLVRLRGDKANGAIAAEMKQAAPPLRAVLIDILATRRALDTIADILAQVQEADPAVRAAAMLALGQLAGPEQIGGMVQGVLKADKGPQRDSAERAVALVCGRIASADKQSAPLIAAMDQLPAADRAALLPTLGRVGGPAALKIVEAAIADSDAKTHEIGLRALCNWPEASIAPRLIVLAETDAHPEHKKMALAALIRVAPLPDKRTAADRLALLQKAMTMCNKDEERNLVLKRASAVRSVESLRFIVGYLNQPALAQQACGSIVELAHHRELREPNKQEFDKVLDQVIRASKDATVIDRAERYKKNQTWARPTKVE